MNKNTKREEKRNPYRSLSFEKISAPMPEKSSVNGKSIISNNDLRVRGNKK